jgi:hypothetical protein
MSTYLVTAIGCLLTVAVCLFAWVKGASAERWGGTLNVATFVFALLAHVLPAGPREMALLIVDGVLAFGLLILAVRYVSLWIGAAMLLQAGQFVLHAFYFIMEQPHDATFAMVNNGVSVGILVCIAAGTALSWRKRKAG